MDQPPMQPPPGQQMEPVPGQQMHGQSAMTLHPIMQLDKLLIRRNVWVLFGQKFRVFDMNGNLLATCKQKAFKLKEDIRIYADAEMTQEMILIFARQVIDFSAAYDVIDATNGEKVGALRRKGWKSIFKDEWMVLDVNDQQFGVIREDSSGMAFLRRFLSNLIPQKYYIDIHQQPAGSIKQHFNPFIFKATMDLSQDTQRIFDRRLAIAAAILMIAIEGRQG